MAHSPQVKQLLTQKEQLQKQLQKLEQILLSEIGKEFMEDYATVLKENDISLPSYFSLSFSEEYNDEGGTDTYLEDVYFYDVHKKVMNIDVEVEFGDYTEHFEYAFREMIDEEFDINELERVIDESDKISLI